MRVHHKYILFEDKPSTMKDRLKKNSTATYMLF